MILFLDTEFTDISPDMELLSLAMVSADGKYEFYGERDDVPVERCSQFAREAVLPQMLAEPPVRGDYLNLRTRLRAFITSLPEEGRPACDSHFDMSLLSDVLGTPWPIQLSGSRFGLAKWLAIPEFSRAQARYHSAGHPYHHALNDARALRAGYVALQGSER